MVGVSADSQEKNDRFRNHLDLPFPLVGDPEGTIIRAYDVRWPILGMAQRVTYVIGRDTKIQLAFHSELNTGSHAAQACAVLASPAS